MSKMPIAWHEEGLKNMKLFLKAEEERLRRIESAIQRSREEIKKIEMQIARAKKEGKDGFDSERYFYKKPLRWSKK